MAEGGNSHRRIGGANPGRDSDGGTSERPIDSGEWIKSAESLHQHMPRDTASEAALKRIIGEATEELQGRERARDEVLDRARKARQLSKQAIMLDHGRDPVKAAENLAEARRLLEETAPHLHDYPELAFYEEVEAAHEEHAEAWILHALLRSETYPTPVEAGADVLAYIMGLGDVPGELRREALDDLRTGELAKAEAHLAEMEEIFLHLVAMEDASLLKGLRRKLDIARSLIEATRSEVTAETGRRRLAETLEGLTDRLQAEGPKRQRGNKLS